MEWSKPRKAYTWEDVRAHDSVEHGGVWVVVKDQVYDVTPFIKNHPPGGRLIERQAGKEVSRHYEYHLEATKHFWAKSSIGWVVAENQAV